MFEIPRVFFKRKRTDLIGINWGRKFVIVKEGNFMKYITFSKHIIIDKPTCLYDSTGQMIYERDIVLYRKIRYVIYFSPNIGKFYGLSESNRILEPHAFRLSEIIGNAIETPEEIFSFAKREKMIKATKKSKLIWPENSI